MINRRNILELIGKSAGKYHSCVITSYSFDFSFFEERVLPALRTVNIKNINLLVDGHYLENSQENTTGKEFKQNKTYNFLPIYQKGVFHPKIILLTGVKQGLLIIGSGNLTSSGLSTNDEIWGAFHLDNVGNDNSPLFGAVWKYLQPYLSQSLGFVKQKIEWMIKFSPWLNELPITNDWIKLDSGEEVQFIANDNIASIYTKLTQTDIDNIDEITIVSPFYDSKGSFVKQIKDFYTPKKIKCIIDSKYGTIPSEIDEDLLKSIDFHEWYDSKADFNENFNRLHAKLVHFQSNEYEYLLFGSANATMAAMGKLNSDATNAEANLLIRRNLSSQNWLKQLDIKIPKNKISLSKNNKSGIGDGNLPRLNYKYKILYSEIRNNELSIFLNKDLLDTPCFILLDRDDIKINHSVLTTNKNIVIIKVERPDDVFKISVCGENYERMSNFCIIHRLDILLRCNPDPSQEKLDILLGQDYSDGEGVSELLQYAYNWDEEEEPTYPTKSALNTKRASTRSDSDNTKTKDYETLTPEEFNKVDLDKMLINARELHNPIVKIADFLAKLISIGKNDDISESEEQKSLEDNEQQGEGNSVEHKKKKYNYGSKEKYAIERYFYNLYVMYHKKLEHFHKTHALTVLPKEPITIKSTSTILIALQLILLKFGKKFEIATNEVDQNELQIKEENYLTIGKINGEVYHVKGFLIYVLGQYFLLAANGSKNYEYDILRQKQERNLEHILYKTFEIILNLQWKESENPLMNLLLLNTMYYTVGDKMNDKAFQDEFINHTSLNTKKSISITSQYKDQFESFTSNLFVTYINWLKIYCNPDTKSQLIQKTDSLFAGKVIFKRELGFNIISSVSIYDGVYKLNLRGCGYDEDDQLLANLQVGSKCVVFN